MELYLPVPRSVEVVLALINFSFHLSDELQPDLDNGPTEVKPMRQPHALEMATPRTRGCTPMHRLVAPPLHPGKAAARGLGAFHASAGPTAQQADAGLGGDGHSAAVPQEAGEKAERANKGAPADQQPLVWRLLVIVAAATATRDSRIPEYTGLFVPWTHDPWKDPCHLFSRPLLLSGLLGGLRPFVVTEVGRPWYKKSLYLWCAHTPQSRNVAGVAVFKFR